MRRLAISALLATSVLHAPAVLAQATPPESAAPAAAEADEIVITAQRRAQSLQDVPISVAVVSGEVLKDRSIQNFEDLAPLVPNLNVVKSPAANIVTLRGIGSAAGSPSLDQSVVMFIDGIYAGNARQFAAPFLDIERLEILRGPQGALVGRNTSAGAINIISRKPGDSFGGYIDAQYNLTFKGPIIEGAVDVPTGTGLNLRFAGRYADTDGFMKNTNTGNDDPQQRDQIGRVTAQYSNGGPGTLTFKYEHADSRVHGTPIQIFAAGTTEQVDYEKTTRLTTGPETQNLVTDNAVLQADLELGAVTLSSISGYSTFENRSLIDADFYSGNFATADFDMDFEQISQEIRLTSESGGTFEYSAGLYYSGSDLYEQRTTGVLFAPPASTYRQFRQKDDVGSAYGQLLFRASERLRVSGSLRYTTQKKTGTYARYAGPVAATQRTGVLAASFGDSIKDDRFDPAASVQFDATDNVMLYGTFGAGSKSAGFQGAISNATAATFAFRPEKSTAYEAGAKITFPGVGFLNLAAFHTVYKDLQVSAAIATPGALSASFFTGNAPKAKVAGVEAEFLARITEIFRVSGSAAWLPTAKYVDFTAGPCYTLQTPDGSLPGSCNQSGNRMGFTPKYSASVTAALEVPLSNGLAFHASASPILQGASVRDFSTDPLLRQGSFAKLDGRIALAQADDRWEIALIGRNLTDKKTIDAGATGGLANTFLSPAARQYILAPSRSFVVQGKVRF